MNMLKNGPWFVPNHNSHSILSSVEFSCLRSEKVPGSENDIPDFCICGFANVAYATRNYSRVFNRDT